MLDSIPTNDEEEEESIVGNRFDSFEPWEFYSRRSEKVASSPLRLASSFTAPKGVYDDLLRGGDDVDVCQVAHVLS